MNETPSITMSPAVCKLLKTAGVSNDEWDKNGRIVILPPESPCLVIPKQEDDVFPMIVCRDIRDLVDISFVEGPDKR